MKDEGCKMYELREFDIRDKEQIVKLWVDVSVKEHDFKEWEEEISMLNESEYEKILVAECNGEIVGSMAYKKVNDETVELKRVYIYPEHRGNGLATKLLNATLNMIKENKYKKILVETWENFISGRRFYEKNNFVLQNIEGEVYNFILEL